MKCRHCQTLLDDRDDVFVDLGAAPPSNAFLRAEDLGRAELHFPLKVLTCPECQLVQVDEVQRHERAVLAATTSTSRRTRSSWLAHAERYVEQAIARLGLGRESLVMEVASNDGYLLQYVAARGIPCVGIEPTAGTAEAARAKGIETHRRVLRRWRSPARFAAERGRADLILGNNVLAHVPDIDDFVAGLREALAPGGIVTVEFPHLLQLVQEAPVRHDLPRALLVPLARAPCSASSRPRAWRCGTSRRCRRTAARCASGRSMRANPRRGRAARSPRCWPRKTPPACAATPSTAACRRGADAIKDDLLAFLIEQKRAGRTVAGYGAAAKGNTLLNYAGVRPDLLPFVVDASPHKQGRFLPGSRIPVRDEAALRAARPDFVLILPWNLRDEIAASAAPTCATGAARFVTAVPELRVW